MIRRRRHVLRSLWYKNSGMYITLLVVVSTHSTIANIHSGRSGIKSSTVTKESRQYRLSPIVVDRHHRKFSVTFSILSPS